MVKDGQNIYDLCIQGYGQLDQFMTMITDNSLNVDDNVFSGQEITYQTLLGNQDVKTFVLRNSIVFNNNQENSYPPLSGGDYNIDYSNDYY